MMRRPLVADCGLPGNGAMILAARGESTQARVLRAAWADARRRDAGDAATSIGQAELAADAYRERYLLIFILKRIYIKP